MATFYSKNIGFIVVDEGDPAEMFYYRETDRILTRLKDLKNHVAETKWDLKVPTKPSALRSYMALGTDLSAVIDCFESVFRDHYEPDDKQLSLNLAPSGNARGKSKGANARA